MKPWFLCQFVICVMVWPLHAAWNSTCLPVTSQELSSPAVMQLEAKIIDSVKNSWCSKEKAQLLFELVVAVRPAVCVEIGAFTGSSSLPMVAGLQYLNQGQAYIIDAWSNDEATSGLEKDDPNSVWWGNLDMSVIKGEFLKRMNSWSLSPYFRTLHMSSKAAISKLPPIDFLHIDGNFSEQGAKLDSELYLPKVVKGGYVLLSNILVTVNGKPTKMKALWSLFEYCEIISELENGNAILFKKN